MALFIGAHPLHWYVCPALSRKASIADHLLNIVTIYFISEHKRERTLLDIGDHMTNMICAKQELINPIAPIVTYTK